MEMMESAGLPDLVIEKTDPCWYCKEEPPPDKNKNDENENPPSPEGKIAGPENSETNDASTLGTALDTRPLWKIRHKVDSEDPIEQGKETEIVPAAYHLLPGNASVNKAGALHKYMLWQGKNDLGLSGPIGYDINNSDNGVWLPGNYAVRQFTGPKENPTKTEWGKNWSKFKDPFRMAYAKHAMKSAKNKQLHDAHYAYNNKVRTTLEDTAEKLNAKRTEKPNKCPICNADIKGKKTRPPYGLVGRLNRLSEEHEKALIYPENNRKAIASGYYTSSCVLSLYGS